MRRTIWRGPDGQLRSTAQSMWEDAGKGLTAAQPGQTVECLGEVEIDVDVPPLPLPPPPPPDDLTRFPEPLAVVDLYSIDIIDQPSPGTLCRLHGTWTDYNIRLSGLKGTAEHPIVIQGADDFKFLPGGWEDGRANAILDVVGEYVIFDGLTFDGGDNCLGRLLNISSAPDRGVSHHVTVQNCHFVRSFDSAIVAQGHDLRFLRNEFAYNCRVNAAHDMGGGWPYTVGTWPYRVVKDGPFVFNRNCQWIENNVHDNHGEGLHPSYCAGVLVEGNQVSNNLYVNIALNNTADAKVVGNRVFASREVRGKSNDLPRAIEAWVEKTSTMPTQPNAQIIIHNNVVNGSLNRWFLRGIGWRRNRKNETDPNNAYTAMTITSNAINGCSEQRVAIDAVAVAATKPSGCVSDVPRAADALYGDMDAWLFV